MTEEEETTSEHNFCVPSQLRQFELVVEGRSLFVNAHYLAEISPYFHLLCFGEEFRESRECRVEIADEPFDDVMELLLFICPDRRYFIKQYVSDGNFALLAHFSHRMQLPNLVQLLEQFIEGDFSRDTYCVPAETLVEMTVEAIAAGLRPMIVTAMCRKLAMIGVDRVNELTKELPVEFASVIQSEVREMASIFRQDRRRNTTYNWNDFAMRLFF